MSELERLADGSYALIRHLFDIADKVEELDTEDTFLDADLRGRVVEVSEALEDRDTRIATVTAECNALRSEFVSLQEGRDGVWAHFSAGGKHYSVNLSASEFSREFAIAYHEVTAMKDTSDAK